MAYHAILDGTNDIATAALATTLTATVVFISFVFLSGRLALYYIPLAVSVSTAMIASLFVAFGWVPMVLHQVWARPLVSKMPDRDATSSTGRARALDRRSARHRRPRDAIGSFLHGAATRMVGGGTADAGHIRRRVVGVRLQGDQGRFLEIPTEEELFLYLEMPSGTDLEYTSETLRNFEEQLLPIPEGVRMSARAFGNQGIIRVEFEEKLRKTPLPFHWRELLIAKADETGGSSVYLRGFSDRPCFRGRSAGRR